MSVKELMFSFKGWIVWSIHSLCVAGAILVGAWLFASYHGVPMFEPANYRAGK